MSRFVTKTTVNMFGIALFIIGTSFLLRSCSAHGAEWEDLTPETQECIELFYNCKQLRPNEERYYIKKKEEHYQLAIKYSEQVFMACWYCPNINNQEKARMCYNSVWAMLGSSTPQLKLIMSVGSLLMQYGLECMREWNFIQDNLHNAQHHFEMYEFYTDVLNKW